MFCLFQIWWAVQNLMSSISLMSCSFSKFDEPFKIWWVWWVALNNLMSCSKLMSSLNLIILCRGMLASIGIRRIWWDRKGYFLASMSFVNLSLLILMSLWQGLMVLWVYVFEEVAEFDEFDELGVKQRLWLTCRFVRGSCQSRIPSHGAACGHQSDFLRRGYAAFDRRRLNSCICCCVMSRSACAARHEDYRWLTQVSVEWTLATLKQIIWPHLLHRSSKALRHMCSNICVSCLRSKHSCEVRVQRRGLCECEPKLAGAAEAMPSAGAATAITTQRAVIGVLCALRCQ